MIYDCVQYTKNDWRNRNKIKTQAGVKWITIPVHVPNLTSKIDEINVSDAKWGKKHWQTLSQSYSRAKKYNQTKDIFEQFYMNTEEKSLSKINAELIKIICVLLKIDTKILDSREFKLEGDRNSRLVSICKQLGASHYLSGPAAKSYLNEQLLQDAGIKTEWMNYSGYPEYEQRFPPFEHGVSVLDLLFNEGENARDYMLISRQE